MLRAGFLVCALFGVALLGCSPKKEAAPMQPESTRVSVVVVTPERVQLTHEWVATLDGYINAQIRPQVSGYLVKKSYEEGQPVKRGQVLFEIDPRPFRAALAQAKAEVAQAKAQVGRTDQDVRRNSALAKEGLSPQAQVDTDVQANLAARAGLEAAEAARQIAELNLGFTQVRSLVDGIAAIATAQLGDLVGPSTLLTTVSQVDPIKVFFSLSEREYLRVAERLNRPKDPGAPWQSGATLALVTVDGKEYPGRGEFLAADREIDPRTGTIRISALFPNPNGILRPGQFGRVRADTETLENALLVPARALSELQGKSFVRVAAPGGVVQVREVTLGQRVGGRRLVERGLAANDSVIIDATQLREGARISAERVPVPAASGP